MKEQYIECFSCKEKIKINYSTIPSNQKIFYYTCPNCNAELKRGNPNYTNNGNNENVLKLSINKRIYNGIWGKGSIFSDNITFILDTNNAISQLTIEFCIDEDIKPVNETLQASIPFILNNDDILKLNNILNEIKNNYNEFDKSINEFPGSPEYIKYTDVIINDMPYYIKSSEQIISDLRTLIKYDCLNKILEETRFSLLNSTDTKNKNNKTHQSYNLKNIFCKIKSLFNRKRNTQKKLSTGIIECPNCNDTLTFLMPNHKYLYCNTCDKFYKDNNGKIDETTSPYTNNDRLY